MRANSECRHTVVINVTITQSVRRSSSDQKFFGLIERTGRKREGKRGGREREKESAHECERTHSI